MITALFTTDYGLIAVAATLMGLLLPLGFHLFIRRKIRESELVQLRAVARTSSGFHHLTAGRRVDSPPEN
jgi:hypothetical protein